MSKNRRSPSHLSTKQLARTVMDGRRVTFRVGTDEAFTGYLCGMDDFHWMIVTPMAEKYLIHKASTPAVQISDESTYSSEICHRQLEEVVGPFRRWVEDEIFGRRASASASEERAAV